MERGTSLDPSYKKTKQLTESAVAATITAILVLLKLTMPFLVVLTMMTSGIPIALICKYHGMRWGLYTVFAEVALVNMIGGPEIGLTTAFYAAALGLAVGYGMVHEWSYKNTLHLTALAFVVEMTYKIVFSIYVLGIKDALTTSIDRIISFMSWIWEFLAKVLGFNPAPDQVIFSNTGMAVLAVIFIADAYLYAYWHLELTEMIGKRLGAVKR